ncbi:hypothetical protein [Nodularia spumigena]|uniref:hypothetical protein n=1 Tax=Nodularia spumigena TaxID=70799 RepID=UPI002B1F0266|nr:hypothetical protein [Nodularia spumigena]MEA5615735.1 hypothetical protein [Nodularia spumigena UHCC 0040]
MKRLILLVALGVTALALSGVGVWMVVRGLDPIKYIRDMMTGYQSGHARHRFPPEQVVRWDPIGDHNAAVAAMAPEDRAYPLLVEATARLRAMRDESWDESWGERPGATLPDFITARSGDPEWARLAAWLEEEPVREVLAIVREAAGRPQLGQPLGVREDAERVEIMARHGIEIAPDPTPPPAQRLLLGALLPSAAAIRDVGRLCVAWAELAAERGDAREFEAAVVDLFGLASLASEPGFVINHLIRIAVLMMAVDRTGDAIMHHPGLVDDAMAARFDAMLADALAAGWTAPDPTMELAVFEDILRSMVDNRGVFNPALGQQAAVAVDQLESFASAPASTAPLTAFNADLLACYRRLETQAAAGVAAVETPWQPYAISQEEFEAWLKERDSIPGRIGKLLLGVVSMDWSMPAKTFRTAHHEVLGLRVALAAHRHQLRHGQPASSLGAIDSDLLIFDPIDGFTGGRLVYRWTGEGHLVYAFGADHDDDGGRPAADPDGAAVRTITDDYLRGKWDGDWVVFPPRE